MALAPRRVLERKREAVIASRIGETLIRRRSDRIVARGKARDITTKTLRPGEAEVVPMHKDDTPLGDILERARYEIRMPRPGEYLHVSDLLSKCVRKAALEERYDLRKPNQSLSLTDSLTFRQGDAIHDVIKERVAQGGADKIWGIWRCRCHTTKTAKPCLLSEVDPEILCNACKTPRTFYDEVPMRNEEYKIVGTPDLLLYLAAYDAFHINEIKSIAADRWKELVRPLPEHVLQATFYWFLMNALGYKLLDSVSILYVTKGWMFSGVPYKEYTVNAQDMVRRLSSYLEDAKALKAAREGGGYLCVHARPTIPLLRGSATLAQSVL